MCTASRNTSTVSASLDVRVGGPLQEAVEPRLSVDGEPERQEVQRQEAGQRQPGDAVHHRRDPQRVAAVAARAEVGVLAHRSTTATTALRPQPGQRRAQRPTSECRAGAP